MTTNERLDRIESLLREHIVASRARSESMANELAANTEVTTQIKEAARAAIWVKRAIAWVGGLGAGLYGVLQLLSIFTRGGDGGP